MIHALLLALPQSYVLHGTTDWEGFGYSLAALGDVDGDGVADFVIGAFCSDGVGVNAGSARLTSGADGAELAMVQGGAARDRMGEAVAALDDLDGDGALDFLASAPGSDAAYPEAGSVEAWSACGKVRLWTFYGQEAGWLAGERIAGLQGGYSAVGACRAGRGVVALVSPAGSPVTFWRGVTAGAGFGMALAGVPDMDGDGIGEVVVSTRDGDYVQVFSTLAGIPIRHWNGAPGFGSALAACGSRILVGNEQAGQVTVLDAVSGAVQAVLVGGGGGGQFGHALALDGSRIYVGAPAAAASGRVVEYDAVALAPLVVRNGLTPWDNYGAAVALTADALVIGAPSFGPTGGAEPGAVEVW